MDGSPQQDRVLSVEQDFEWFRLGDQLIARAYEEVVPVVRRRLAKREQPGLTDSAHVSGGAWRYATGA